MEKQQAQFGVHHHRTYPWVLVHRTHPMQARQIIENGVFYGSPHSTLPGLNATLRGHARGASAARRAAGKGVRLVFAWDGPVRPMPEDESLLVPNFLYGANPDQVFVPEGTSKYLRLVDVELEDGESWVEALDIPRSLLGQLKHLVVTSPKILNDQARILGQKLELMAMKCQTIRVAYSAPVEQGPTAE